METNNNNVDTDKLYIPSHAVHPFEILKDELAARGISQKDFAEKLGMRPSNFNRLLKGRGDLNFGLALQLEELLDIPADHWMLFMKAYIRDMELIAARDESESKALAEEAAFNERISVKDFYHNLGLTYKSIPERVNVLKDYQDQIFNPEIVFSNGAFKRSERRKTDSYYLLTWVVIATALADKVSKALTYSKGNAEMAAMEIAGMANMNRIDIETVKKILNQYGIGYVHLGKLDKTPVDAYSTMRKGIPVIVATYRINDRDKFVFDILHELGHIALHMESGQKQNFLNIHGESLEAQLERQADSFAQDHLIPPKEWKDILTISTRNLYPDHICRLIGEKARSKGYNPTIAVSRYKHESNVYNVRAYRSPKLL